MKRPFSCHYLHYASIASTQEALRSPDALSREETYVCAVADFQTAGRGQRGNSWSSDAGQNLTYSFAFRPEGVEASRQFLISEAVALAILALVEQSVGQGSGSVSVKWPNDIYVGHSKIAGILIEHDLLGSVISRTIAGIGLNVNQTVFPPFMPPATSLRQLSRRSFALPALLSQLMELIHGQLQRDGALLHQDYLARLYRRTGLHPYRDACGVFFAEIDTVLPSGELSLLRQDGPRSLYRFKEVTFVHTPSAP